MMAKTSPHPFLKSFPHEKSKKFPPKERRIVLSSPETGAALF